jgi:hypothetical protein
MNPTSLDPRARIERELAERLAAAPRPSRPRRDVALLCLGCRAMNDADALFCTACGERFNALLVATRARGQEAAS